MSDTAKEEGSATLEVKGAAGGISLSLRLVTWGTGALLVATLVGVVVLVATMRTAPMVGVVCLLSMVAGGSSVTLLSGQLLRQKDDQILELRGRISEQAEEKRALQSLHVQGLRSSIPAPAKLPGVTLESAEAKPIPKKKAPKGKR